MHLDDKFGAAITDIAAGDVAQDIYNRTEAMAKRGEMITGRQKYRVVLDHLGYDEAHGFTYNILSIQKPQIPRRSAHRSLLAAV